jgi:hypothetical protein
VIFHYFPWFFIISRDFSPSQHLTLEFTVETPLLPSSQTHFPSKNTTDHTTFTHSSLILHSFFTLLHSFSIV